MKGSVILMAMGLAMATPLLANEGEMAKPTSTETPTAGGGKETVCKNGAMVRRVKLAVTDGTQAECRVSYQKETEEPGATEKVLWNARQQADFCQEKANGFVEKLKGMGWSCE